ncbi:hypothetical protein GGU11DRAFT_761222 [Lentinula aff. detonsa]|nr:hypothetical protein GGU11DRAFT_761222 [Lentinula aff. detonsa]
MQKLPEKFRADLRDCKVSEQLPYAEWKAACKDVEERRPPVLTTYAYPTRRPEGKPDRSSQPSTTTGHNASSGSMPSYPNPRSHRFPKLQLDQKKILIKLEACFRCYNLFAGHLSNNCSNVGPPILSVPYRPLNDADVSLATKIHDAAPDNSIPYELILKRNVGPVPQPKPVAMVQERIALTEIPNLDIDQPEPTFNVHSRDVAAVYGSRDIVHFSSGPDVYGTALDRGFDYKEPAAPPIRKPVATLVPARRSVRDYRDNGNMGRCSPYSPPQGRNTRRLLVLLTGEAYLLPPGHLVPRPMEMTAVFQKAQVQYLMILVLLWSLFVHVLPLQ